MDVVCRGARAAALVVMSACIGQGRDECLPGAQPLGLDSTQVGAAWI